MFFGVRIPCSTRSLLHISSKPRFKCNKGAASFSNSGYGAAFSITQVIQKSPHPSVNCNLFYRFARLEDILAARK